MALSNGSIRHTEYLLLVRCKFPPGIAPTASVPGRAVTIVKQGHNAAQARGWHPYLVTVPMTAPEIAAQSLPNNLSLTINGSVSRVVLVWD